MSDSEQAKLQRTFNMMVRHMRSMTKKSTLMPNDDSNDDSAYRGDDGMKCPVGALIPDELYSPDIEFLGATSTPVEEILKQLGHDAALCEDVQEVHDIWEIDEWEDRLQEVADEWGLVLEPREAQQEVNDR